MSLENVDVRVLGSVRIVDAATAEPLYRTMQVDAPRGVVLRRNRAGDYVIWQAPGLAAIVDNFEQQLQNPPDNDAPALESVNVELQIRDPLHEFLPRRVMIALPRDGRPANARSERSLFVPVPVRMYPSPAGRVQRPWASARVNVRSQLGGVLAGALLVVRFDGADAGRGLTGPDGEALVLAPSIPRMTWSENRDAVLVEDVPATLLVVWDRQERGLPNPDLLESAAVGLVRQTFDLDLHAGRERRASVEVNIDNNP